VLLVSGSVSGQSPNSKELQKRFEAEAPAAWDEFRQANRYAQGTWKGETEATGLADKYRGETELKVNETCRVLRVTDRTANTSEVFAQNPKYWFHLKSGKGKAWILFELYQTEQFNSDNAKEIDRRLNEYGGRMAENSVRLNPDEQLLSELIRSPQTRFISVISSQQDGVELVEVKFETPENTNPRKLTGGVLLLQPTRNWLPVKTTAFTRNRVGTGTHTVQFEYLPGQYPLPRHADSGEVYQLFTDPNPWKSSSTGDYNFRVPERLPDTQEFTLTAFGLPEPVGVVWVKPTPRYVWFLAAAVVFALVAITFRWLARRRETPSISPTLSGPATT